MPEEPTTPDPLETLRGGVEAFNRRDFDTFLAVWARDAVWVGVQGMKEGFLDWVRVWRDWTVTAEDYRELDAERVLVLYRDSGRTKESGPEGARVENKGASLFQLRDQLVTRIIQYYYRDRAFADLGLALEEPNDPR
jgi:ketosteroid isomerase-like protein